MGRGFLAMLGRDLRLAYRQGSDVVLALAFFIIAASLFPLGVGPDPQVLAGLAAGVIWVLALLSVMLSLDRLFQSDYDDGALELMALSPVPMTVLVLAKSLAHWLTTGVPLLVLAPVIGVLLNMPADGYLPMIVGLAIGTPTLSLSASPFTNACGFVATTCAMVARVSPEVRPAWSRIRHSVAPGGTGPTVATSPPLTAARDTFVPGSGGTAATLRMRGAGRSSARS